MPLHFKRLSLRLLWESGEQSVRQDAREMWNGLYCQRFTDWLLQLLLLLTLVIQLSDTAANTAQE